MANIFVFFYFVWECISYRLYYQIICLCNHLQIWTYIWINQTCCTGVYLIKFELDLLLKISYHFFNFMSVIFVLLKNFFPMILLSSDVITEFLHEFCLLLQLVLKEFKLSFYTTFIILILCVFYIENIDQCFLNFFGDRFSLR